MKILFLYGNDIALKLADWLIFNGEDVRLYQEKVTVEYIKSNDFELIISYTYRYILTLEVIKSVNFNAVNIHISYLPWNRGANPNQWSFIEDTPKGVSIHYISVGLDKGDIISQRLITFSPQDTLATSYQRLNDEAVDLFKDLFKYYPFWNDMRKKTVGKGSYHNVADFKRYQKIIGLNYDIPISKFCQLIKEIQNTDNTI